MSVTREDVIRGLGCCLSAWRHCDKCPYKPPRCAELLTDAMALLEALEPVEPTWRRGFAFCGKCGGGVGRETKYCPICGRGVKWQ